MTPDTNHHPRSQHHNHHPADNPYSDQTRPAGYQNRLFTNKVWGGNDPRQFSRQQAYGRDNSVTPYVQPKVFHENRPKDTCEMFQLEKYCANRVQIDNMNSFKNKKRSYSESYYGAPPPQCSSDKRGSSESGYGTSMTTRSSVSSGEGKKGYAIYNGENKMGYGMSFQEERLGCKCRHAEDDDEVFYKVNEEVLESELMINNENYLQHY